MINQRKTDGRYYHDGFYYFRQGYRLLMSPGLRRYALLPLLINMLLLGGAFYWLYDLLQQQIPLLLSHIPASLHWLYYVLWPLAIVSLFIIFGYFFSTVANILAAPFCGLLAERVEQQLTGQSLPDTSLFALIKDLPRIMLREWQKLKYYLPRVIILILLHFIPIIGPLISPVLWLLFGAWMMAIQYCDYPFDNHRINFSTMRHTLRQDRLLHIQFGGMVSLFTVIPIVNLTIMVAAVCGATAIWVDRYRYTTTVLPVSVSNNDAEQNLKITL